MLLLNSAHIFNIKTNGQIVHKIIYTVPMNDVEPTVWQLW